MESPEERRNHHYLFKFNQQLYLFCETKNELFFYQETPAPSDPVERSILENAINKAIIILRAEDIKTGWANVRKNTINDQLVLMALKERLFLVSIQRILLMFLVYTINY